MPPITQTTAHSQAKEDKPRLSFWQIWNMSFGFLGIQFGFELQNSNVSRIFETLGANKEEIPLLWLAAPITGLLVQPVIGYLSDRTWHPYWGRRRPFFAIGAILASLALIVLPNSTALWVAGGMLWIMDASINISMEPFRAFVGDKLPSEQRTSGFALQSFFIGVGSVIAALLPWVFYNWFHISNVAEAGVIPASVKWSFYVGAFAFFTSVMYTVFTTRESPPEDLEKFREETKNEGVFDGLKESFMGIFKMPKTMQQLAVVQFFSWFSLFAMWIYSTNAITSNFYDMKVDNALYSKMKNIINQAAITPENTKVEKELNALKTDLKDIDQFQGEQVEKVITINLANYFTDKDVLSTNEKVLVVKARQQYNDGSDWIGICSSIRNGVAAVFAFLIPLIARRSSRKFTHMLCLILGGFGLISLKFIPSWEWIGVSMVFVGIAWASILSMPYAILAGALPANKMGYYMGVFNFFIVLPQIVAGVILGFLTTHVFHGNTLNAFVLGGCTMILAGLLTLQVKDDH